MIYLEKSDYKKSAEMLKDGKIIAFPTETVFGLAGISTREDVFNRLVKVKKRPSDKPFTLMCSSLEQINKFIEVNDVVKKIIERFMPGPLTIVLRAKNNVPGYLDLNTGFIGVRIPYDEFVLKMIDAVGEPLLVPSANISFLPPALNSSEVYEYFNETIDGIVIGNSESNIPSTVIKVDKNIELLREGEISFKKILEVIEE